MVDFNCVTNAINPLFVGSCNIYTFSKSKDPISKLSSVSKSLLYSNQPCRISFSKVVSASKTDTTNNISLGVKLFICNNLTIPSGSDIEVIQDGVTYNFTSSGVPSVYPTHQEVMLEDSEVFA